MGCKLKEGMCKGVSLGYMICSKDCPNYKVLEATTNLSDYELWKQWLDMWNVIYEEKQWNSNKKELIIGGGYCQVSIVFDLENNFKCITAYE